MHSYNTQPTAADRYPAPTFSDGRGRSVLGVDDWLDVRGRVTTALGHSVTLITDPVTLGLALFAGMGTLGQRFVPSARLASVLTTRPRTPVDDHRQRRRAIRFCRSETSAPCPIANNPLAEGEFP